MAAINLNEVEAKLEALCVLVAILVATPATPLGLRNIARTFPRVAEYGNPGRMSMAASNLNEVEAKLEALCVLVA
ncbi:MAG TPA: hypothetical protein VLE20_04690, partial [Blastocatellia bacterium]|nr:hypothetical protein [Blastocatellia bacterium]